MNPFSGRWAFDAKTAELVAEAWWVALLGGLISIGFGVGVLAVFWPDVGMRPELTLTILITLTAVWAIATGIWECAIAFELRNRARRREA